MPHPLLTGGQRSPLAKAGAAVDRLLDMGSEMISDPFDAAEIAHQASLIEAAAAMLRNHAERSLCGVVERHKVVDDVKVGRFIVRRSRDTRRTKWDHERIGPLILTRILREAQRAADGWVDPQPIWQDLRECAGIGYWKGDYQKKTGTFAWGVDKDDYCETEGREAAKVLLP